MKNTNWTREQLLLAFNLYCEIPFGQFHQRNPRVIELANLIGRSPSAVAMKLGNFASLDESQRLRGIKGLSNASKADKAAWEEFTSNWEQFVVESETLLTQLRHEYRGDTTETTRVYDSDAQIFVAPEGPTETQSVVWVRRGQDFFRRTVLSNFNFACCICGMPVPNLLVASHIIPWSAREDLRLNPHNGLCLCAIHDRGFDQGYISLDESYLVLISPVLLGYLPNEALSNLFERYRGQKISLPEKFMPDKQYLKFHREQFYREG